MSRFPETIVLGDHRVLQFAKAQLLQMVQYLQAPLSTIDRLYIGTREQLQLQGAEAAGAITGKLADAQYSDEFVIARVEKEIYLIGVHERAALYAVYELAEKLAGVHWLQPGEQPTIVEPTLKLEQLDQLHSAPLMERRGFVFETIDDATFMKGMTDWLVKNKINELFFTFTLWHKLRPHLQEIIVERGFTVTLGGHSTKFFVDRQAAAASQAADHPYTAKRQLDYEDLSWQAPLLEKIAEYCAGVPNLARISLWPEDIKHQQSGQFLSAYIRFSERLQQKLHAAGLKLEVEHIAYNAGLAWDMLEREGQQSSAIIDTLYAYWGRDYQHNLAAAKSESDRRAYKSLNDWQQQLQQKGRKLTVFEYYSDHFMLSPIFPMLTARIVNDIRHYKQMGIDGITNLVVPAPVLEGYSWKWNQIYNSYVFARALWNQSPDDIQSQYFAQYAPRLKQRVRQLYNQLEENVTALTSWNVPLFPARAVDPLKAHATDAQAKAIIQQLDNIAELADLFLAENNLEGHAVLESIMQHYASYSRVIKRDWLAILSS